MSRIARERCARRVVLFGSYAPSSSDRHSDLDLIIVDDQNLPYLRRLDKYFDAISEALHVSFDLFVYTSSEIDQMRNRPFVKRALREGIVLYEC